MTWKEWIDLHAAVFPKMGGESGLATLAAWTHIFARIGATPAHMGEGSYRLAEEGEPKWPAEHLAFLTSWAKKVKPAAAVEDPAQGPPGCKLCGESGYVSVPTSKALAGGFWSTAAVTCRCPLGLFLGRTPQEAVIFGVRVLRVRLEEYEEEFPDWRDRDAEHAAATGIRNKRYEEEFAHWHDTDAERVKAQGLAADLGKSIGRVLAALRRHA